MHFNLLPINHNLTGIPLLSHQICLLELGPELRVETRFVKSMAILEKGKIS